MNVYTLDSGSDIREQLELSGEPEVEGLGIGFNASPQKNAQEIAAINVAKREYQKKYMDYWNASVAETETGRPVDGVLCPVAPFAAARPGRYTYYGYTTFVNVLDYTSVVIPVTKADRKVDTPSTDYKPLNEADEVVYRNCRISPAYCWTIFNLIFLRPPFTNMRLLQMAKRSTTGPRLACSW
jgi:amidase